MISFLKQGNLSTNRSLIKQIEESSDKICRGNDYVVKYKKDGIEMRKNLNVNQLDIGLNVKRTKVFTYSDLEKYTPKKGTKKTKAHFLQNDILDVSLFISHEVRKNPLVLVMGDPKVAGGEDHNALFGVESNIWRRTAIRQFIDVDRRNKYFSLLETDIFKYEIPEDGVLYCPEVPILRSSLKTGYHSINPDKVSFAIISPILKPELDKNERLSKEDQHKIKTKFKSFFLTAIANNHDVVIISAFGCGYAQNPPKHVSEILAEVVNDFRGVFSNVVFAILDNDVKLSKKYKVDNAPFFASAFKKLRKNKSFV